MECCDPRSETHALDCCLGCVACVWTGLSPSLGVFATEQGLPCPLGLSSSPPCTGNTHFALPFGALKTSEPAGRWLRGSQMSPMDALTWKVLCPGPDGPS